MRAEGNAKKPYSLKWGKSRVLCHLPPPPLWWSYVMQLTLGCLEPYSITFTILHHLLPTIFLEQSCSLKMIFSKSPSSIEWYYGTRVSISYQIICFDCFFTYSFFAFSSVHCFVICHRQFIEELLIIIIINTSISHAKHRTVSHVRITDVENIQDQPESHSLFILQKRFKHRPNWTLLNLNQRHQQARFDGRLRRYAWFDSTARRSQNRSRSLLHSSDSGRQHLFKIRQTNLLLSYLFRIYFSWVLNFGLLFLFCLFLYRRARMWTLETVIATRPSPLQSLTIEKGISNSIFGFPVIFAKSSFFSIW